MPRLPLPGGFGRRRASTGDRRDENPHPHRSRQSRFGKCCRRNRARNWLPGWVIVGCGNDVQLSRHPAHAWVRLIIRANKRRSTRLTRAPGSRRRHPRNESLIAPSRMASRDTREIRPRSPPVLGTHLPDYCYDRCGQRSDTEVKEVGFKERPWPRKSHFLLATFPGGRPPTSIVQHHGAAVRLRSRTVNAE